jgi:hypothetical protein
MGSLAFAPDGRLFITERPTKVATIGIGYGDGYPRHVSGHGAEVWLHGRRCPILGRVTMDQLMADVTAVEQVAEGDEVTGDEDVREAGEGEVGERGDAAGAVGGDAEFCGEWVCGDAGGPDDGGGFEGCAVGEGEGAGGDAADAGFESDFDAKVGEAPESDGTVQPGTVVTAVVAGGEEVFLLGNREIAANSELDVYSEASPLGAAILGLTEGAKTSYTAPNGREISVEIVKVETYAGQ